ncbi:MAG: hypothetical protein HFJ79_00105 [Clostridiales bacterium]|jgi:hypothetical protein|nr:hypothetical protein [Clostridiales bacterium]
MAKHRLASKIACSLFAVVTVATAGMITAGAAGNISDSNFSLSINQYQYTDYTPRREKRDSTSVYMYVKSKVGSIRTHVVGATDSVANLTNCSLGYYYTPGTGVTYMINNVYETGKHYAAIRGDQGTTSTGGIDGVWSPDSV